MKRNIHQIEKIECFHCKLSEVLTNETIQRKCGKQMCYACTMYEATCNFDYNIEMFENKKFKFYCICCYDEHIEMDIDTLEEYITNMAQCETQHEFIDEILDMIHGLKSQRLGDDIKKTLFQVAHSVPETFPRRLIGIHEFDPPCFAAKLLRKGRTAIRNKGKIL